MSKKCFYPSILPYLGIPISHMNRQTTTHKTLVDYAFTKMYLGRGFRNIKLEHMFANKKRIDLIAMKNKEVWGIECTTFKNYREKEEKYLKYVDKLVFCIPERRTKPKPRRNRKIIFWVVPRYKFKNGIIR